MTSTRALPFTLGLLVAAPTATAQWIQRTPAAAPTARSAAAMDFVPQNGGLVLFGGGTPGLSNQTWLYDGTTWTQLNPATAPSGRFGAQLVYDTTRGVAVLYGGLASAISIPPPTSDTWEWDGTTWTLATPAANAGPRYRYAACYDPIRGRVVMYGGATTQLLSPPSNQTWEYQGTTWSQVNTLGNPGPRDRAAMCFHLGLGKAVLFGGADSSGVTNQTWLYDGSVGIWTQVAINGPVPPARNAATLVYDPLRNLCVLHGGQGASVLTDTWAFDGTRWIEQPTTTQGVRDHNAAFLPSLGHVVKFGGFVAAPNTLSAETWEIGSGVYGVGCNGSAGVPTLSATSAPRAGQGWTLTLANLNPAFNLAFLVFGFTQLPGIDLTGPLNMPGCLAFTTPDIVLAVNGSGGAASWTWPTVAAAVGGTFDVQALCLDPPANGFGFTISNAVYATIAN